LTYSYSSSSSSSSLLSIQSLYIRNPLPQYHSFSFCLHSLINYIDCLYTPNVEMPQSHLILLLSIKVLAW
jgi:hypothetical protein